nr:bifunctional nuclease domain-containing protein [Cellulomonas sp. P24]
MANGEELVTVEVVGVRQHVAADELVVLLFDPASSLVVPILVGPAEASAIATVQAGVVPPRPMTHDLICSLLEACGTQLMRVEITSLIGGCSTPSWSCRTALGSTRVRPTGSLSRSGRRVRSCARL